MTPQFVLDTSALVAVVKREEGHDGIADVVVDVPGLLPAPVVVEFMLVTSLELNRPNPKSVALLALLERSGTIVYPFNAEGAAAATIAGERFGKGGGSGVSLNMLDLMVYGTAKVADLPILCTGRDFAKTDIAIHPASRVG